jgi:hemerythrin-like domain-containing protein
MLSHESMTRTTKSPRVLLLEDHHHIDSLLDRLRAAVHADDREAIQERWALAEKVLLKHLDVEEVFVFPALKHDHASEVDALLKEHASIRHQIGELGLAVELHTLRCDAIEAICASLRAHASREDAFAYALADAVLGADLVRMIASRIRDTLDALRRSEARGAGAAAVGS